MRVAKARERMVLLLDQVEGQDDETMLPAEYNPRQTPDSNRTALNTSLKSFGYSQDIVVNRRTVENGWKGDDAGRYVIVGGHLRREELLDQGFGAAEVTVLELDDAGERAANVTFNNPRAQGEFTDDIADVLQGIDLEIPRFDGLGLDVLAEEWALPQLPPEIDANIGNGMNPRVKFTLSVAPEQADLAREMLKEVTEALEGSKLREGSEA